MENFKVISLRIYFIGLICLAVGLSLGNFPISLSQFILGGAWFLYPDYREKIKRLLYNKPALILMSVYIMHLIGILYTSDDLNYAMKDLRIKLPLLTLPLIIGSMPVITKKQFDLLLKFFLASLVFTSIVCTAVRAGLYKADYNNIRDISIYISHIRYSLLLCTGIFYAAYNVLKKKKGVIERSVFGITCVWLIVFLFILESPTGIGIFILGSLISMVILIWKSRSLLLRLSMVVVLLIIPIYLYVQFHSIYNELFTEVPIQSDKLELYTADGNRYTHQVNRHDTENGNLTWIYICWDELNDSWRSRSTIDFNGHDKKDNLIKYTLVRYMTSKGLRKDAQGVQQLTDDDINKIERGVANVMHHGMGDIHYRVYQLVWEYRNYINGGNPSGHSLAMRFEYWKASLEIIRKNPLIGVGTGDLPQAYVNYYNESNSSLGEKWRRRAHNQYLSIATAFGITGLLWFLFALFYPAFILGRFHNYYYLMFFVIAAVSMLTEDTIETQVGVTFFAFLNSLLLLGVSFEDKAL